jgi:plastocyanin
MLVMPTSRTHPTRSVARVCATGWILVLVFLAACGGGSKAPTNPGGSNNNTTITNVSIQGNVTTMTVGQTLTFTAVAFNSTTTSIPTSFTWSSGNNAAATVGATTGIVTAVGVGIASINATAGGKTGARVITVSAPGQTGPAPLNAVVDMPGNSFTPSAVTIKVNGTVSFVFSANPHNVQFGGTGAPANIAETSNQTVDRTFNTAGSFTMVCTLHVGMTGTVTVQP